MSSQSSFRLGSVLVEPSRLRVSSTAGAVTLQSKVMGVLVALSSHGTAVVSRQALVDEVWGSTNVGYHALARAIYEARKALAVVEPNQQLIETLPQRGYRVTVTREDVVDSVRSVEQPLPKRIALAISGLIVLGLWMHAIDAHGSPGHLIAASATVAGAMWPTTWWRRGSGALRHVFASDSRVG